MRIAYTLASGRGETNILVADLVQTLQAQGVRLCGTVQIDIDRDVNEKCDMDVRVLPDGPTIRISQSLGKNARGCRLDPDALEQAVALAEKALDEGTDLLIVNKFGKHEADGRGFRNTIARALELGVPVLVGANKLNVDALVEFCGGIAEPLPAEPDRLLQWALSELASAKAA
ncbi:Nucleoside-triphosphatase THEP1 [Shimia gijangensis]|uniref:Nucleoside-triphosphatase THEP1 n=1 Tax=Shimia gijangensis TaxID=1470563 RepID=A0A1M6JU67_9RHOB|nr:DUF2478 domain-containing protein [Shimia gijangensis]SHJ50216.1 Nucleoside-triphosphatase THEP1 [Shimia gijangensis]